MSRQLALWITLWLPVCVTVRAEPVYIGVFVLFHPTELRVTPVSTPLLITSADRQIVLEGRQSYTIHSAVRVASRDGSEADFRLSLPGKIERQFHGLLNVRAAGRKLTAVITMDLEVAVASVVAAEMPASTPLEALKAQAVIARSYYAASVARHHDYSFCDTTHCQFLRAPPAPGAVAFRAAEETQGLVLEYEGSPVAALYSAACGGRTKSQPEGTPGYPYFSVSCEQCRRHSPGVVKGHRLGLCQTGATGMAAEGADFRAILNHYYPATVVKPNPRRIAISTGE